MIRSAQSLMIIAGLMIGGIPSGFAQGDKGCTQRERYTDSLDHCTDVSPDDVIVLGSVRVVAQGPTLGKRVVLHDDVRGDIELLLTPGLVQTIDEYPADSFEVEGSITNGQMTVKNLRPIE